MITDKRLLILQERINHMTYNLSRDPTSNEMVLAVKAVIAAARELELAQILA